MHPSIIIMSAPENGGYLLVKNAGRRASFALRVAVVTLFIFALMVRIFPALAAAIIPGDLIIFRVGDGTAALTTTAVPAFLDEYAPSGVLVQSIPLPSNGANALTATGNATTEGIISRSQDRSTLIFGGYRKDAGGTNPSADTPATTNRVIGTVGLAGVVNTSIALTDPTGTMRSATSLDGSSSFYFATSGAVRYVASPGPAATSTSIDARNSRQVNLSDNTLFASNGSTSITTKVQSYGILPTGMTAPAPIVTLATTDAVNGFSLFDLSPTIPGDDTLYALSTVENMLRKYVFDGSAWNLSGAISGASAADLTGATNGTDINLYLTSPTGLFAFTDSSGYAGTLSGALGPAIATASVNTAFRGIGLIAIPEPTAIGLTVLGLALFSQRVTLRRRPVSRTGFGKQ